MAGTPAAGRGWGCVNETLSSDPKEASKLRARLARLIGTPTHWEGSMQVYCGRSGLLHQVGRG